MTEISFKTLITHDKKCEIFAKYLAWDRHTLFLQRENFKLRYSSKANESNGHSTHSVSIYFQYFISLTDTGLPISVICDK